MMKWLSALGACLRPPAAPHKTLAVRYVEPGVKSAVQLLYEEGYTGPEIARSVGLHPQTVESLLRRLREAEAGRIPQVTAPEGLAKVAEAARAVDTVRRALGVATPAPTPSRRERDPLAAAEAEALQRFLGTPEGQGWALQHALSRFGGAAKQPPAGDAIRAAKELASIARELREPTAAEVLAEAVASAWRQPARATGRKAAG